ncbi:Transmembrane emp24 domain-containing protein p24delta9 [Rhynchospora pubera]|uniref:Transmembrane emp24 domain-containing protein p24delta9 n=1 Tax=Rhynchospora pubera TaxID=906938 RepID=A0AAV8CIC3_9POAL|nr:Transmembrane emp24 domain-containing protein p24delta9 [Rhynchospora pubera]
MLSSTITISTYADPRNHPRCAIWQSEVPNRRPPQWNSLLRSVSRCQCLCFPPHYLHSCEWSKWRITAPLQSVESGQFSFEVGTAGSHTACFWSPKFELTASVSVDMEWNLRTRARSPRDATKKGNLEAMGLELKKLENAVKMIHDEMIFLREREADTQMFNKETASKMSSLSLLSLAICLGVASLQIWHLKAFFQSKKIL